MVIYTIGCKADGGWGGREHEEDSGDNGVGVGGGDDGNDDNNNGDVARCVIPLDREGVGKRRRRR